MLLQEPVVIQGQLELQQQEIQMLQQHGNQNTMTTTAATTLIQPQNVATVAPVPEQKSSKKAKKSKKKKKEKEKVWNSHAKINKKNH